MDFIKTTKAIRFRLENNNENTLIQESINNLNSRNEFDLNVFVDDLDAFISDCNDYLFCSKKKGRREIFYVNPNLIVKNEWLKKYAKQDLAELKQNQTAQRVQYKIGDIDGLDLRIQDIIDDMDLCVLLGNALENAYEACQRMNGDKKWIKVKLEESSALLSIAITNSFDGKVSKRKDKFLSSKRRSEPGFGLQSIREICEKYNGTLHITYDEDEFDIMMLLNVNTKEK